MTKVIRSVALAIVILALLAALLLFTPLGARPLSAVLPVGDVAVPEFETVDVAGARNRYLVCPPGLCVSAPHRESPVFDIPVEELVSHWKAMIAGEPQVTLMTDTDDALQYVQRTARFRFPDIVTVRFIGVAPARSTLAVYSRSVYGVSDLGENRRRVEDWLGKLQARAAR